MIECNGPEPCISSFATGRCYSPVACEGYGYYRDRNLKFGVPDEATAMVWRMLAKKSKFEVARAKKADK